MPDQSVPLHLAFQGSACPCRIHPGPPVVALSHCVMASFLHRGGGGEKFTEALVLPTWAAIVPFIFSHVSQTSAMYLGEPWLKNCLARLVMRLRCFGHYQQAAGVLSIRCYQPEAGAGPIHRGWGSCCLRWYARRSPAMPLGLPLPGCTTMRRQFC